MKEKYPYISGYQDAYLAFENVGNLTSEQIQNKKLFNEFFEQTDDEIKLLKESLADKLQQWIAKKMYKTDIPKIESKVYKLKDSKAHNCRFVQGDIMDIDKFTSNEKADVILFRNSLYHLVSTECFAGFRYPKKDAEITVAKLGNKFKNGLNDNGIVVFGENEFEQMGTSSQFVPAIMKRLGFKPLDETENHFPTIWQKTAEN